MPPTSITIISGYQAQVALLASYLRPRHPEIEIGTVDAFQGRENDVVIVSLVRSNEKREVGFLTESRRLNGARCPNDRAESCSRHDSTTPSALRRRRLGDRLARHAVPQALDRASRRACRPQACRNARSVEGASRRVYTCERPTPVPGHMKSSSSSSSPASRLARCRAASSAMASSDRREVYERASLSAARCRASSRSAALRSFAVARAALSRARCRSSRSAWVGQRVAMAKREVPRGRPRGPSSTSSGG